MGFAIQGLAGDRHRHLRRRGEDISGADRQLWLRFSHISH
jgi:hypothetical protein